MKPMEEQIKKTIATAGTNVVENPRLNNFPPDITKTVLHMGTLAARREPLASA